MVKFSFTCSLGESAKARVGVVLQGLVLYNQLLTTFDLTSKSIECLKTCEPDNRDELPLFPRRAQHLMSRRLPNPPGPNLHQVAEVDQEGVGIVRKNWDWSPRPVQLGLQPVGPASPQEGEPVVVGVLRVQDLGTRLAIGLVSSQSQLT